MLGGKTLQHSFQHFKPMINNELSLHQLSTACGGKKTNLAGFISEPDVGASRFPSKGIKRAATAKKTALLKDSRPSNCSSRLIGTNVFPMSEW